MKRFMREKVLLLFVLMATGMVGCSKDGYVSYDADYASLRFVYTAYGNDSVVYSFALHPGEEEGIVEIPFKLVGLAAGENRAVGVEVMKEGTTAKENEHFSVETSELLADSIRGNIVLKVMKTPDLDARDLAVVIRLCGDEHFAAAPVNENTYRVVLTNRLVQPKQWPFGEYSRVKHQFVIVSLGISDYDQWSKADEIYYRGKMINALYEYNRANPGKPLTDENGLPVTFE